MADATEIQCIFAYTPADKSPSGVPVIAFLMPEAGWAYMASGLCHEFDLTKIGVPIQVVIGRCRDRAHGRSMLNIGPGTADLTGSNIDMHIGTKQTRQ